MLGEIAPEGTELCYTSIQFHKQVPSTINVDIIFVVVPNHEPVLEVRSCNQHQY